MPSTRCSAADLPGDLSVGLSGWSSGDARYELKFVGPAHLAEATAADFGMICRRDSRFPDNVVHTLYFDSPRLRSYEEKGDGDYRKLKYRLRWYADARTNRVDGRDAWLEIKARDGSLVTKQRRLVELPAPPDTLSPEALTHLSRTWFPGGVRPSCWLSYRRRRLTSLDGVVRVAVDQDIRVVWLPQWVRSEPRTPVLPLHVVELKGPTLDCAPLLLRAARRYARASGMSKYAMCIDHLRGGVVI